MSSFDSLVIKTNNIMFLWKKTRGFAPTKTADKLDNAMLELHCEMTRTLKIWIDKGLSMTNGELVLARANIGAVVESWLKFFYCVYYEDYLHTYNSDDPDSKVISKKGEMIQPDVLSFDRLKNFSVNKLWPKKSSKYKWVEKIQQRRNAIHYFSPRNIGTPQEFLDDVETLLVFVNDIENQLPPIEDFNY